MLFYHTEKLKSRQSACSCECCFLCCTLLCWKISGRNISGINKFIHEANKVTGQSLETAESMRDRKSLSKQSSIMVIPPPTPPSQPADSQQLIFQQTPPRKKTFQAVNPAVSHHCTTAHELHSFEANSSLLAEFLSSLSQKLSAAFASGTVFVFTIWSDTSSFHLLNDTFLCSFTETICKDLKPYFWF